MNLFQSKPDGLRTGFAIALAGEEATQLCDQAKHFVKLGLGWLLGLSEQVRAANFVDIEEQFGIQIRASAARAAFAAIEEVAVLLLASVLSL